LKKVAIVETSATIANFGPGFDTFGLCLDKPRDVIELEMVNQKGIRIELPEEGYRIPTSPLKNTASIAAKEILKMAGKGSNSIGLKMTIIKGIRPGSGLGSSAASAVGGALATATLLGIKDKKKILLAAAKGEGVSSGAAHLDNVSPCLFGGFTVVLDHERLDVLRLKPPQMKIVICLPEIYVETAKARQLIPKDVPLKTSIAHSSWASGIIQGIKTNDLKLMARCLRDEIAVPPRKQLIRGFDNAREAAITAGALSFSISGSGPAVYSLAVKNHKRIGESIVESFSRIGVKSDYFIAKPGMGAKVKKIE